MAEMLQFFKEQSTGAFRASGVILGHDRRKIRGDFWPGESGIVGLGLSIDLDTHGERLNEKSRSFRGGLVQVT